MKYLGAFIGCLVCLNCLGQFKYKKESISKQTNQIVLKIQKVNELMGSAVGNGSFRPAQYDNFIQLSKKASVIELEELTNHPNGVVRCYAFWALSHDSTANLFPIVIKHIHDTASVSTQFGCIGGSTLVGDFFIKVVSPRYVDFASKKLTSNELAYLDSILIYTPKVYLYARTNAIDRANLTEKLYVRIRQLVLKENNQSALVILAKFQKEQDTSLILKNKAKAERYDKLYFTYRAISQFPHSAFLRLLKVELNKSLEHDHWSTEWREMYKAIASYKTYEALLLLKIPFTQVRHEDMRKYHLDFVFEGIQNFHTPIYQEILWDLWTNEKLINSKVFTLLYDANPSKGFEQVKKTLENANDYNALNSIEYDEDINPTVNLLAIMLDTILHKEKSIAIDLINKNLKEVNVLQFETFAKYAGEIKDSSFVESLFYRLEKEDNPHVYLKATSALIAYKDKVINKKIVEASKRNKSLLTGWGGDDFRKLLKENNIQ